MFSFPTEKIFEKEQRQIFLRRLIRRVFYDDWLIKVFALLITLALWFGVTGLRAPITTRLNNVTLKSRVSNELEITNSPITEVDLVITGDKRKIDQINSENLIVSFDLTEARAGEQVIELTPENVNVELPTGVKLEEIQPNKIAVKLENVMERDVPVKPEIEGNVADGYEIYSAVSLPPKVRVRGPESFVKSLDFVSTEEINIENQQSDFNVQQVALNVVNPKITPLDSVVDVVFKIGERRIERLFIVPVEGETEGKTATVVLYGARSLLNNLRQEILKVQMLKTESDNESLQLVLPAEIQGQVEIRKLKIN